MIEALTKDQRRVLKLLRSCYDAKIMCAALDAGEAAYPADLGFAAMTFLQRVLGPKHFEIHREELSAKRCSPRVRYAVEKYLSGKALGS